MEVTRNNGTFILDAIPLKDSANFQVCICVRSEMVDEEGSFTFSGLIIGVAVVDLMIGRVWR